MQRTTRRSFLGKLLWKLERGRLIQERILGMRSTELRNLDCSWFHVLQSRWSHYQLTPAAGRCGSDHSLSSTPHFIFKHVILAGHSAWHIMSRMFLRFLGKWPPQRSCHVTRTRRDKCTSSSYGLRNQGRSWPTRKILKNASTCYAWVVISAWRIARNCPSYSWTPISLPLYLSETKQSPDEEYKRHALSYSPPSSPLGLCPPPCLPFVRLRIHIDPLPRIPTLPVTTCCTDVNNLYPPRLNPQCMSRFFISRMSPYVTTPTLFLPLASSSIPRYVPTSCVS